MVTIKTPCKNGSESVSDSILVDDADSAIVVGDDAKLLILHFKEIPADIQHKEYFNHLCGAAGANGVQLPPCIVVVGDNISFSALDENMMEEFGWVRKEKVSSNHQIQG